MTRPAAEGLTPEEWAVKAACGACMHHKPCMEARVVLFHDAIAQGRAEALREAAEWLRVTSLTETGYGDLGDYAEHLAEGITLLAAGPTTERTE